MQVLEPGARAGVEHQREPLRRSWAANDFMWGRLDGAAALIGLLVDDGRARALAREGGEPPWTLLARALVTSEEAPDNRWLLGEVLGTDFTAEEEGAQRLARLEDALRDDLDAGDGRLTRILFTRAAQLRILQVELPVLVSESARDARRDGRRPVLAPTLADDVREAIEFMRRSAPLPELLGRDARAGRRSVARVRRVVARVAHLPFRRAPLRRG